MGETPRPRLRRLVLLVWVLVIIFYVYLSYDFISAQMQDGKLAAYLDYVVQLAGNQNRPTKEVRALILVKAEELGLPIQGDQIQISGGGPTLKVSLSYGVDIEFPVFERVLYHKNFEHNVAYHQLR
jgi:hypothetical protein